MQAPKLGILGECQTSNIFRCSKLFSPQTELVSTMLRLYQFHCDLLRTLTMTRLIIKKSVMMNCTSIVRPLLRSTLETCVYIRMIKEEEDVSVDVMRWYC